MAEQRYRADSEYAFTQAVIAILQLARSSADEFSFGPTDWATAEQQGMLLSGDDIETAKATLSGVAGVAEADS